MSVERREKEGRGEGRHAWNIDRELVWSPDTCFLWYYLEFTLLGHTTREVGIYERKK